MFRLGRGRTIHGIEVFAIPPHDEALERVGAALDLVARFEPRSLARLGRHGAIMVHGKDPEGAWYRDAAVLKLARSDLVAGSTHPTVLAATLVREATRARLEASGLDWAPDGARRIETLCRQTEARFAARLLEHLGPAGAPTPPPLPPPSPPGTPPR